MSSRPTWTKQSVTKARAVRHRNINYNQSNQIKLAKPLCLLILLLILCNLITLYFLNKSVQRTSSMHCPDINRNIKQHNLHQITINNNIDGYLPSMNSLSQIAQKYAFPNLLEPNEPYSDLPYLPHNIDGQYINTNPHSINDPVFIESIKKHFNKDSNDDDNNNDGHIWQSREKNKKYVIRDQLLRPDVPTTLNDELKRNNIITNEELWNLKETNNNDNDDIICDDSMEYLLNTSIHSLHMMKGRNFIETMICPDESRLGWRHSHYVPFIFGNHCEPWWQRDAIYIVQKLLNKDMIGIEWGSGASSLWLSMLTHFLIAIEHDKRWVDGLQQIIERMNLTNLMVTQENLGRKYCELDYAGKFDNNPGGREWKKGGIDFVSMDGRLRYAATEWMLKWIKPHGGILIFDNSDRIDDTAHYGQINATDLIPKHWLRYDSSYFDQHIKPINDKKWLRNSMTTIWITRHKKCIGKNEYKKYEPFVDDEYDYQQQKQRSESKEKQSQTQPQIEQQTVSDQRGDTDTDIDDEDEDDGEVLNFKPF